MMDRETEMYHAAIKILSNRADQLGIDEDEALMHKRDYVITEKAPNTFKYEKISYNTLSDIIDKKIENIPYQQLILLSTGPKYRKEVSGMSFNRKSKTTKQYEADHRLYDSIVEKITKDVMEENNIDNMYSREVNKLVKEKLNLIMSNRQG